MPEPSANLELIRRLTANSSRAQLETMKNNMILGQSWDRILMSAPNAIAGMGSCYVAAAIPEASLIKLRGKTLESVFAHPLAQRRALLNSCLDTNMCSRTLSSVLTLAERHLWKLTRK
jgi:hypothetical protein